MQVKWRRAQRSFVLLDAFLFTLHLNMSCAVDASTTLKHTHTHISQFLEFHDYVASQASVLCSSLPLCNRMALLSPSTVVLTVS